MKIIVWPCVCPVCRVAFSAYLADVFNPQRDEIAHDKRALLCNVCERKFLNLLYSSMERECGGLDGLASRLVSLSALRSEAQRAGEPGSQATVGTGEPSGLFDRVQGMHNGNRDEGVSSSVRGVLEAPESTLRGPTVLPTELPE